MLRTRILSALVLIPLIVAAALAGGYWFAALIALFAARVTPATTPHPRFS